MATDQLTWRTGHSPVLIRNQLYSWGGQQKDLHLVHDSEDKRKITSEVDILQLATFKWERKSTMNNPPAGVLYYACTNVQNNLLYFGGNCNPGDCYHNNLYSLNTLTLNWSEIISAPLDNVPMRKHGCGMISFNVNGEDNLFLSGGKGLTPVTQQTHSQYVPSPSNPHLSYTNEIHCMNLTSSPGQWIVPVIRGTRPPPCAEFTLNNLPGNRGVIFGGVTIIENTRYDRVNDLYLFQYSHKRIDFEKIVQSSVTTVKWPKGRERHASSIINTISSNQQITSHMITLGGRDDDINTISDCWIINLATLIWYQINLPESVTKRYDHSITTCLISNNSVWVIVTGGAREYDRFDNTSIVVTGSDITMIVELEYINEVWIVKHVWNNEQLMNDKKAFQKSLILHNEQLKEELGFTQQQLRILQKDAGKKLHDNEIELRRQRLELTKEKKRNTDLELELQSVQIIVDCRNAYINQLKQKSIEMVQRNQLLIDQKIQEVTMLNKELQNVKMKQQRCEVQLLEVNLDLWGKDEELKEITSKEVLLQRKVEKLQQDLKISQQQLSAKQLDTTHQHEQLSLLNNERIENQRKIKHLQSGITRLKQTVEIWKKDSFQADVGSISIAESYQESGLEESKQFSHSEHETLEGVQVAYVKTDLNVPQEFEVETEEIRKLEYLMNDVVSTNQTLKTQLKKKEELLIQLKKENQEIASPTSDVQEGMPNSMFQSSKKTIVTKAYRDMEVQVDYQGHLTDHLSGVHIVAQSEFLIRGSKPQSFLWVDFGFNLYFEQGTIRPLQICHVNVNALVGGTFRFPKGTQLVSAIYAISFAEDLLQPVTLEMQHCVLLKSEEQFKYLSFMIAHVDESAPPYEFHLINGGKFKVDNLYGRIKRQKFCLVGIGKKCDGYSSHETSNGEGDPPSDGSYDDDNDDTSTNSDIESDIEGSNSGNVPSIHEDMNTVNDIPIESTTHVENDDVTIFQNKYNPYENVYNEIQFPDISYPSLHLLEEFDHNTDSKYNDTCEIHDENTTELEAHNVSQESNTELNEDTQSELRDQHINFTISATHMKENGDIPLSDPSDSTTHHFISVGVQVPGDSDIPDNIYTGGIYYERIASNKWLTRFIVIQNIKVFLEYMETKHSKAEQDEIIRFQFVDPVNGCIELDMNMMQERSFKGWTLVPHKRPLRLTKRDADLFGSQELPIPPSCLITVWGKITDDTEDLLSYSVGLNGIDSDTKEICINRFLETTSTTENTHHRHSYESQKDNTLYQVSLTAQKVKEILRVSTPEMSRLLSSSDNRISLAMELYGSSLITDDAYSQAIDDSAITNILKGARLMKEITTSIGFNPDKLRKIIEVMKRVETFQDISDKWARDIQ